ncbi:unnamed protein product [Caenorhabditis angaria]|uniref:Uncharacterized protein n=1 Tax=Caenorhabditis angaria TaxID=860376 RepID=A0A9P1I4G4_9PELO|nr:unnamed protein product [Caenorhabditis angaria]
MVSRRTLRTIEQRCSSFYLKINWQSTNALNQTIDSINTISLAHCDSIQFQFFHQSIQLSSQSIPPKLKWK